jgi:hypothetical protein
MFFLIVASDIVVSLFVEKLDVPYCLNNHPIVAETIGVIGPTDTGIGTIGCIGASGFVVFVDFPILLDPPPPHHPLLEFCVQVPATYPTFVMSEFGHWVEMLQVCHALVALIAEQLLP